ncbi:universal stress protein [Luteococcus sp. Sow4_B9]|uniref:universal stress protein n=1 Tax=Luteococcus sp. Sow4_B9 TaxID=3438792 RepID=UPI003F9DA63D
MSDVTGDEMPRMNEYRTIVVGTDGSALAEPTVARAAWLAHHNDADLVIVCAWSSLSRRAEARNTRGLADNRIGLVSGRQAATDAVTEAVEIARRHDARVAGALLVDGEPGPALIQVAGERRADLLVVGAIQDVSIADRLLGNVATDVVKRATCEVLIVRPPMPVTELEVAEDLVETPRPPEELPLD